MWIYHQKTGRIDHDNACLGYGYSGCPDFKNKPEAQYRPNEGPIPRGDYAITGEPYDSPDHGPYVLRLEPATQNVMFNRAGFLIHGDSVKEPGTASKGCIILNRHIRESIWASGDKQLTVVE